MHFPLRVLRGFLFLALLGACAAPTPAPTATPRCPPNTLPCPATQISLAAPGEPAKVDGKVEMSLTTDGAWANPYDPAQVDLEVRFTGPGGQAFQVPAFWYQDFDPATLQPKGAAEWRVRFTPTQAGAWLAQAIVVQGNITSAPVTIPVAADPAAKGFVQVNKANPHYFGFADGSTFLPIGLNLGWADSLTQTVPEYDRWLGSLSQNGGNIARVWMASWSVGIEWKDTGLGNYDQRQEQAYLLDHIFDQAAQDNVYILLSLLNHGAFNTAVDPEWKDNPYNLANGGVITNPVDFVTNPAAINFFKQRVRYIAARWGYSTHLFAWEWWNEVNFTGIPDDSLQPWLVMMTHDLQQYDPYGHMVTTSYAEARSTRIWKTPELSFMEQHDYTGNDPAVEFRSDVSDLRRAATNKPLLVGEHGMPATGEPDNVQQAASLVHFHDGLWAAPFSGLAGSAMAWYWNDFVEPNHLWPQYKSLAGFFDGVNLAPMQVMTASVSSGGSAGDASSGAIALSLQSPTGALVWLRSPEYTAIRSIVAYEKAVGTGPAQPNWTFQPPALSGLTLTVRGLQDGSYNARWYDPQSGQWQAQAAAQSADGSLSLPVPSFSGDAAVRIEPR